MKKKQDFFKGPVQYKYISICISEFKSNVHAVSLLKKDELGNTIKV